MFLKINTLIAVSALAISTAAVAQNQPAQPTTGKSETAPGQTQTTPGQQTTPGEASREHAGRHWDDAVGRRPQGQVAAAAQADFKKGATVYDSTGAVVGTVDS